MVIVGEIVHIFVFTKAPAAQSLQVCLNEESPMKNLFLYICMNRMAYRRQKRWWNAYILFYERQDEKDEKDIYKTLQDLTIGLFRHHFLNDHKSKTIIV